MPWLLLVGAAIGLALAAWGLLEKRVEGHGLSAGSPSQDLSPEQAAIVGDRVIRRVDYERMLAGLERDLRNPIDDATRRRVLERMIDEELLVQQALALGLASADRRVRGELVSGLVDSLVAEADGDAPSDVEVEAHYRANLDFFTRPGRLRVEALFFAARRASELGVNPDAAGSARERAEKARVRLVAGDAPERVEKRLGDPRVAAVPDALLPIAKLRDYLGPRVVASLADLAPDIWSEPIESAEGCQLVRIVEREAHDVPPFQEVEPLVRQDLVRQRGDAALRRYLDTLRQQARIERNEELFRPAASASK